MAVRDGASAVGQCADIVRPLVVQALIRLVDARGVGRIAAEPLHRGPVGVKNFLQGVIIRRDRLGRGGPRQTQDGVVFGPRSDQVVIGPVAADLAPMLDEHRPQDPGIGDAQPLQRPRQCAGAGRAGGDDHQGRAREVGKDQGVGEPDHRWSVEDHMVKTPGGVLHQIGHARARQEFDWIGRYGAAADHKEPGHRGRLGDLVRVGRTGQTVGESVRVGQPEGLVQGRVAQIAIDQQDLAAALGEGDRRGAGRGGLALPGGGAAEVDDPRRAFGPGQGQRRAK